MKNQTITSPAGFLAAGVTCGIKASGLPDLAILTCERPAAAAAVFTTNDLKAAPVVLGQELLPRGHGRIETIVINSGNANACTGKRGLRDARRMADLAAEATAAEPGRTLVSSTGVIGTPLPMEAAEAGILSAAGQIDGSADAGEAFARAIMTTDQYPKQAAERVKIGKSAVTVAGAAKGAGMISPNMATMLAYITTDADVSPALLRSMLKDAVAGSFNSITVDGHTSTNDTVVLLASGLAGNTPIRKKGANYSKLAKAVASVCGQLAELIVRDGEGATKLVRVQVAGAASVAEAEAAARAIADSPLVKCAFHGSDPNWGRITSAAGFSSARCNVPKMKCAIGGVTIFRAGQPVRHDTKKVAKLMAADTVDIRLDLGAGKAERTILTCDLGHEYVTINAEYHT